MGFIQEKLLEINIGLKKEYTIIHFSDVHIMTYSSDDSKEVKEEAIKQEELWYRQRFWFADKASEHYDESHNIPSCKCLNNLIDYVNEEKPDVAVLAGDIIDYYSNSNYKFLINETSRIECSYIFTCGNHESDSTKFYELFNNEYGYSSLDLGEFKLVSINNSNKKVSRISIDFIKSQLDKPCIIVMHIPLCTSYNREEMKKFDPYFLIDEEDADEITKEFIDIVSNNNMIKALLCGHIHAFGDSYFAPNKKQFCSSSGLIGSVNKIIVQ